MLNRKKYGILLAMLLTVGILMNCFAVPLVQAADLSDFQQKQAEIQKKMNDLKKNLKSAKGNIKTFQKEINSLDGSIADQEKNLKTIEKELSVAQEQLKVTNQELEKAQEALSVQFEAFESRLYETYVNGEVSIIDVLFDSTSMEDFITRSYYMEKILEYDAEMVGKINDRVDEIETKKAERQAKTTSLADLKKQQQASIAALEYSKNQKTTLLADAEEDKETFEKAYNEMEADSNRIAAEIRRIQAESSGGGGGQGTGIYAWPLPSNRKTVTSNYGMRMHPTQHVYKMHTGIDISAPNGVPIYAADSGKVIMAGNNGAYGYCVIIDHGDGMATLYGHMSKILTSSGQTVSKGDTIGKVGSTGWSTGNHLHFEVRKNGNHVSPWNYVSK